MSAAKAIGDHLRDWVCGSGDRWVSMAVNSTGNKYNVPEGLIYSFPVTTNSKCNNTHRNMSLHFSILDGTWAFVQGLTISAFSREKLDATATELADEKAFALDFLKL